MSKIAKEWAHRQNIADGAMKPVLVELAYLHMSGRDLFPSQAYLAQATGNSERTVRDALRLLELFGLISRMPRSKGARGRTTDLMVLALDRDFNLTKSAIAAVRRSFSNRRNLPVTTSNSLPAKSVIATGEICRGIGREQKVLSHTGTDLSVGQYEGPSARPTLRLVGGGSR